MALLSMNNVRYKYASAEEFAVKEASCSFEPGKLYAVTGPSGSGKSTILSLLAGLDRPTEGSVTFDGEDLQDMDLDRYRREDVSMIFQAFQLFPLLTAMENVCYPLELLGVDRKRAREQARRLLSHVGIAEAQFRRFPSNLSGGEQQRVAIARSLASGARILLADEPTGNLDGANTENVMDILTDLARQNGYCVIVVTHDKEVADRADIVYRMIDGRLVS